MDALQFKVDELITIFDKSELIKNLEKHKEIINNDKKLQKLILNFNMIKEKYKKNPSDKNKSLLINVKKELFNNPAVKEYKNLENELHFLIMQINIKFNKLINKNSCNKTCE